ncbi:MULTISPECIES: siphovirus Gp157 family protein [Pantoea]|uniref:siphovirus Gp157 family protein n=1 Tax=Pantoea TaxID=53335 RepID=UPI00259264D8|nr:MULTISPECIES: siphovirus Gp157 family protein [Pantoea]
MTALYKIANEFAALSESGMEPDMIADTLDGIQWELESKVEQCLAICKNEQAYAEALREESNRLLERARAAENRVMRIKEYVATSLETTGKKTLQAGIHQVTVREPAKSVEITDAGSIPPQFVDYETTIKPNKLEIRQQIEAGIPIPGAHLKLGKPSLIIR